MVEVSPSPPQSEGHFEKVLFGVQKLASALFGNLNVFTFQQLETW
jgi:hypothetical protein